MKKMQFFKILIINFFLLMIIPSLYARNCSEMFIKYNISPEIKSRRGWKRVINKNELYKYLKDDVLEDDVLYLNNCLIINGFNIKHYNRSIGEKL